MTPAEPSPPSPLARPRALALRRRDRLIVVAWLLGAGVGPFAFTGLGLVLAFAHVERVATEVKAATLASEIKLAMWAGLPGGVLPLIGLATWWHLTRGSRAARDAALAEDGRPARGP